MEWCIKYAVSLGWRHNGRDSVSNDQPHDCLLNRLFRRRSKKTSKLRFTGLCAGNSPGTGEFPAQMASNAENVSIWWRPNYFPNYVVMCFMKRRFINGPFYGSTEYTMQGFALILQISYSTRGNIPGTDLFIITWASHMRRIRSEFIMYTYSLVETWMNWMVEFYQLIESLKFIFPNHSFIRSFIHSFITPFIQLHEIDTQWLENVWFHVNVIIHV